MTRAQPSKRDPLDEWLDITPDQAELDALGKLLRASGRKPIATVRCQRHHALARVFDVDGETILVRDRIKELGGSRLRPRGDERVLEMMTKRRGSHSGSVNMRCRCGNFHAVVGEIWEQLDAMGADVAEILIDKRNWPATTHEDFAERQEFVDEHFARRARDM